MCPKTLICKLLTFIKKGTKLCSAIYIQADVRKLFSKKVQFQNLQKLVGTNLNRPQVFRRAWAGGQVSSFNAYIDKQESTLKGVLKEGSNMQRPNQQKMKILIFSIQYDFQILLKYQFSIQSEEYKTKQKKKNKEQVSVLVLERV